MKPTAILTTQQALTTQIKRRIQQVGGHDTITASLTNAVAQLEVALQLSMLLDAIAKPGRKEVPYATGGPTLQTTVAEATGARTEEREPEANQPEPAPVRAPEPKPQPRLARAAKPVRRIPVSAARRRGAAAVSPPRTVPTLTDLAAAMQGDGELPEGEDSPFPEEM